MNTKEVTDYLGIHHTTLRGYVLNKVICKPERLHNRKGSFSNSWTLEQVEKAKIKRDKMRLKNKTISKNACDYDISKETNDLLNRVFR